MYNLKSLHTDCFSSKKGRLSRYKVAVFILTLIFVSASELFASQICEHQNEIDVISSDSVASLTVATIETTLTKQEELKLRRSERGLVQLTNVFVPKGQWITGTTFSYSSHDNDDYDLLVIQDIQSYGYTLKASPLVAYAIKSNLAVGARFSYARSLTKAENADLVFGDSDDGGINVNFANLYILTHTYSAIAMCRQYIPLGSSRRFALFNEIQLEVGGSQSKMSFDEPTQGTYSTSTNASLGICPGIVAFATNDVAFEVSVGMMGLSYSKTKQIHNQVYEGESSSGAFSFKLNLLAIGLGVSFYL